MTCPVTLPAVNSFHPETSFAQERLEVSAGLFGAPEGAVVEAGQTLVGPLVFGVPFQQAQADGFGFRLPPFLFKKGVFFTRFKLNN